MPLALLALLPSLILLAAAGYAAVRGQRRPLQRQPWIGAAGAAGALGCLALLWPRVAAGQRLELTFGSVLPGMEFGYSIDALSLLFAAGILAIATVAFIAMALDAAPSRAPARLHAAAHILLLAALTACFAGNLLLLYAALEVANFAAFALFTCGGQRRAERAAQLAFVVHASDLGLLGAALWVVHLSGTADLAALPVEALGGGAAALLMAAGIVRLVLPAALTRSRLAADRATAEPGTRGILALALGVGSAAAGLYLLARLMALMQGTFPQPGLRAGMLATGLVLAAAGAALTWTATTSEGLAGGVLLGECGLTVSAWGLAAPLAVFAALLATQQALWTATVWLLLADRRAPHPAVGAVLGGMLVALAAGVPASLGFLAHLLTVQSALAGGRGFAAVGIAILLLAALLAAATLVTGRRLFSARAPDARAGPGLQRLLWGLAAAALAAAAFPQWVLVPLSPAARLISRQAPGALSWGLDVQAVGGAWPAGYLGILTLGVGAAVLLAGRRAPARLRLRLQIPGGQAPHFNSALALPRVRWPRVLLDHRLFLQQVGRWGLALGLLYLLTRR